VVRLATLRRGGQTTAVRLEEPGICSLLPYPDVGALLSRSDWRAQAGLPATERVSFDAAELAPVIPAPGKVVCLGLNYATHIREMGHELPQFPTLFAKYTDALIGPYDDIVLPAVSEQMDWEVELAFVIGRTCRNVAEPEGLEVIAGYTVFNDVTARDWQRRTTQFLGGKTFESTTPVGPWLVSADELPPGASGLTVRCAVDEEVMQEASTADLLFTPAQIVAYISQITTLRPGDLVATGTPAGVGAGRRPPVFLRPGQVVTTEIEGIGRLQNVCRADERRAH
jgi:acylpyruvate hydrolase